jgi:hypothetical protein
VVQAREAATRVLETDPEFTISAWIARGGQSNAKLMIEGLRKVGKRGCPRCTPRFPVSTTRPL